VLLGLSVLARERGRLLPCGIALAAFLAGSGVAACLLTRRREPSTAAADLRYGLTIELPLLLIFSALWFAGALAATLLTSGAVALGVQSVAVRRLKISGVTTTFITGTMTTAVVQFLSPNTAANNDRRDTGFLLSMSLIYVAAAATGALLFTLLRAEACIAPLTAAGLAFLNVRRS
jgi:uncharacterized membrane protein YoaK (UPF0700 family)